MENLVYVEYAVAGLIRYCLLSSDYRQTIADRVEVSTPLNSWKRVLEGAFLDNEGINPYDGDLFHETPLGLTACSYMNDLLKKQNVEKLTYAKGTSQLLLKDEDVKLSPVYVATAYLFNPYIILNCVGQTTTVFTNMCLAATFLLMIKGYQLTCCLALAMATLQALYPAMLIVPASLYITQQKNSSGKLSRLYIPQNTIFAFILVLFLLLWLSSHLAGSWMFLYSTYGFILNVPDLRPNIGLFWYFFTEMFEHFRPLFIWAFQINTSFLYLVPLTLRLHTEPMLLATSLTALTAIFKSYPCLGDVGFYLALLPMWKHLFNYMQQGFVVACFFIITSVLGPIVWHLWIYSRSANANFYFGVTLAFATAQIFLVTDILFAYIKREFSLQYGLQREVNGKAAKLVLE